MADQREVPDWWTRTRLPNAQEGDNRAWETHQWQSSQGYQHDYSETHRHGQTAVHSWDPAPDPAATGWKRTRSRSPSEEQEPSSKRIKINVTDASTDEIDKSGNAVGDSIK